MTLNSNALITLAQAKLFVKVPTPEATHDTLLEEFINEASQLIESYCNRKFILQEFIEIHSGNGLSQIMTRAFPVVSITSLYDDTTRAFTDVIDSVNYTLMQDEKGHGYGVERFDYKFSRGQRNVKIIFQGGYSAIPSDLQLACKVTLAFYYFKQQEQEWTTNTKSKGDENITMIEGLPKSVTEILDKYKRTEILGEDESVRNY